jgi:hypothetical protein
MRSDHTSVMYAELADSCRFGARTHARTHTCAHNLRRSLSSYAVSRCAHDSNREISVSGLYEVHVTVGADGGAVALGTAL